jgi:hypothetical protein
MLVLIYDKEDQSSPVVNEVCRPPYVHILLHELVN